ncbi:hypothetical protein, partial [Salmonella enterica]|uniref:hypothetical protein n=1 Tax=Salmonella enterica TaxID=28901 RepID=UPI0020C2B3E5
MRINKDDLCPMNSKKEEEWIKKDDEWIQSKRKRKSEVQVTSDSKRLKVVADENQIISYEFKLLVGSEGVWKI